MMMIVLVGAWRNQDVKNFFGLEEKFILYFCIRQRKRGCGKIYIGILKRAPRAKISEKKNADSLQR
jgi:hypothetical protein